MPALWQDFQPRADDALVHQAGFGDWSELVVRAHHYQRWHADARQQRHRVGTLDDRLLLADETLLAHRHGHLLHGGGDVGVQPARVDQARHQLRADTDEAATMGKGQQPLAGSGAFRRVEARHGVEQGQAQDSFGGLAHDLEGDVAAHGQCRQGKAGRGLVQHAAGHGRDAVIAGEVSDLDFHLAGQGGGLLGPEAFIVEEARQHYQSGGVHIH
ncbi:hypothetical protein D3C80_1476380 [compost metagenome]